MQQTQSFKAVELFVQTPVSLMESLLLQRLLDFLFTEKDVADERAAWNRGLLGLL